MNTVTAMNTNESRQSIPELAAVKGEVNYVSFTLRFFPTLDPQKYIMKAKRINAEPEIKPQT
jgi:hypothetical protein